MSEDLLKLKKQLDLKINEDFQPKAAEFNRKEKVRKGANPEDLTLFKTYLEREDTQKHLQECFKLVEEKLVDNCFVVKPRGHHDVELSHAWVFIVKFLMLYVKWTLNSLPKAG